MDRFASTVLGRLVGMLFYWSFYALWLYGTLRYGSKDERFPFSGGTIIAITVLLGAQVAVAVVIMSPRLGNDPRCLEGAEQIFTWIFLLVPMLLGFIWAFVHSIIRSRKQP